MKIEISYDHPRLRFPRRETIRAIRSVLRRERKTIDGVSVVFTNSQRIHSLNRKHLGHDYVTDVIAFELERKPKLETEIYINLDRARSQAGEFGETFQSETRRLLIHGLLHVFGYDDKTVKARAFMRREEDAILKLLKARKY